MEPIDLTKFGLIPELVGRLPVVATLDELDEEALIEILVTPKNALVKQYEELFQLDGVELEIRDSALKAIAEKALQRRTGARGLRSILEASLMKTMYEIPDLTNVSKVFTLTKDQRKVVGESELRPKLFTAVDSISFKCNDSSVFALIGPNGSGKTTTLRMISTMIAPTSGTIKIKDRDVSDDGRFARKSIGFMTNQTALYDRLSPFEMVKYFADLNSMDKSVFDKRCKDIFDRLDMNTFANKRIGTLSSGMKQKHL